MKLPDFEVGDDGLTDETRALDAALRETIREMVRAEAASLATSQLEALAKAALDELRNRGRSLAVEADRDVHATALRTVERLAASARAIELIAKGTPANDNARGDDGR